MSQEPGFYVATDISASCFVFASAGSGKTKILVDRYVKSLFFGLKPQEILCITFTNAAVYEIESRVFDTLERLFLNENGYTEKYLKGTLGISEVSENDLKRAEHLFFEFADNSHNIKIATVHSFCQELLQQFPLESGIHPNFKVLDENDAKDLLREAKDTALRRIGESAINSLTSAISLRALEDFVDKIYQLSSKFTQFFRARGSNLDDYESHMMKVLNFKDEESDFNYSHLDYIEKFLKGQNLEEVYLTKTGTIRKKIPFPNVKISQEIASIVFAWSQNKKKFKTIQKTKAFLEFVKEILEEYERLKNLNGCLDFSDVLLKARFLLVESCAKEFVLSKICSRLKSVMIDEAQDLSALQWELIKLFADDIYSNARSPGTIFVVGDVKQSIYRFQGAECKLFSEFYKSCIEVFEKSDRKLNTVYLNKSYRTLPRIIENIDKVFEGKIAKEALETSLIGYKKHRAHRTFPIGNFEIINVQEVSEIVDEISKRLYKQDGSSMILTRSRNELSEGIVKEIISRGTIAIAPPDRIKVLDNMLVLDLLALAEVCIDDSNDYALSCILKSPYVFDKPLSNIDLLSICANRKKSVLENLAICFPGEYANLKWLQEDGISNDITEFFFKASCLMNKFSVEDEKVISGFMDIVTKFSKDNPLSSLKEFLDYIRSGERVINNQQDKKNLLRLSTIHASKGLEADSVFLLDFSLNADKQKTKLLFFDGMFFIKPSQKESFPEINEIIEMEYLEERRELLRLLYVAMTRARDSLYIFGQGLEGGVANLIESKSALETRA